MKVKREDIAQKERATRMAERRKERKEKTIDRCR